MKCPHCHSPVEFAPDDTIREVVCPSCGSSIEVDPDRTESFRHAHRRLGKFEILEQLGLGAFGAVFKARDTELDRLVAIKVPRAGNVATQEDADRFVREARAVARLKHPGIVSVHDASQSDGTFFLISEFVPGVTLADRLLSGRFSFRAAAELMVKVAEAIDYAHRQGVIHRDLKPSNIMLDLEGTPHVMDFGLAKRETGEATLTVDGQVLGTPAYMSPEQARGEAHDVDARSDVYSLGVILYELLTGELPFRGNKRMLILQVTQDEPRPLRRINDVIPRDLETITLRCLAKEPARRYASARELAEELRRWLRGEPILARPVGQVEKLWRWARRNPWIASLSATVLLLLAGIAAGSTIGMFAINQQRAEAQRQKMLADDDRDRARKSKSRADDARQAAIAARNDALAARDNELRARYASDLLLASRAVTSGPLARALDVLDSWTPDRQGGRELRGPEWHLVRRLCDTSALTLAGHEGPLRALDWTTDGKRLASGGHDCVVRIWDAKSGKCLQTLVGHTAGVFDVAFSPDGSRLASASADSTVRVWDTATGHLLLVLDGHILPVYAVAFHPGGKQLATAGADTLIKVWSAADGKELFTLQGHEAPVGRLQFDADGKTLTSSGIVRGTILWDFERRTEVDRLNIPGDIVFTPDLATATFALPGGIVGFFTTATNELDRGNLGLGEVHAIALDKHARIAAIAGSDDAIHVVDRRESSTLATLRGHLGASRRLVLSGDARRLASAGDDGTVRLWELPDPAKLPYAGHHEHNVTAAGFAASGQWLATGDYLGSIAIWDAVTGKRVQVLGRHYLRRKNDERSLRIGTGEPMRDDEVLQHVSGYTPGSTDPNPIVEVAITQGHGGEVRGVAFTPDQKHLISAGGQDFIVWDVAAGKALLEFEHPTLISSLAVSADGKVAATGCWDDVVRVFEVPSGKLLKELEGHANDVMCVAFHPSGGELASGSRDHSIIVWDTATGQVKEHLKRHTGAVTAIAYSPDGVRIVSGGMDQNLHVWTREPLRWEATLHGHQAAVTSLAFSHGGERLISGSDDERDPVPRVWLWDKRQFRECLELSPISQRGITAVAIHPLTGAIVAGRGQLEIWDTSPATPRPPTAAPPAADIPLGGRQLKVLGHALIDSLVAWPGGAQGRRRPQEGHKFLVVAVSLPFERLKVSTDDYEKLTRLAHSDADTSQPLKTSSMLVYPHRFALSDAEDKLIPAAFVGYRASKEEEGMEFMDRGVSLLENLTNTPAAADRQLVCLAWEVASDFMLQGQRLKFDSDEPVVIPPLVLESFRPGKPHYPATRDFEAGEGGDRLRSNLTRSPGL